MASKLQAIGQRVTYAVSDGTALTVPKGHVVLTFDPSEEFDDSYTPKKGDNAGQRIERWSIAKVGSNFGGQELPGTGCNVMLYAKASGGAPVSTSPTTRKRN